MVVLALVATQVSVSGVASAADGDVVEPPPPTGTPIASGDTIGSLIVSPGGETAGGSGGRSDGCEWVVVNPGAYDDGNPDNDDVAVRRTVDGREQVLVWKVCDGVVVAAGWAWATPTPGELVAGLVSHVQRQLPAPSPAINPAGPGFVNLGLWLAVEDGGPVEVANDVAGWSVVVTAVQASTSFQIGDLQTVTCDGVGVPIVDTDVIEEGPCGYTFRSIPDGDAVTITITTSWDVTYTTPVGDGSLGTLTTSVDVPYEVREIQTVGLSG